MTNLQNLDQAFVAGTYKRFPVSIVSGKGSTVYDEKGTAYIDMGSGIGVTAFGINDEKWNAAVIAQLSKVQHMSNLYYTEPCAKLAQLICEKTGMSKVFFGNSGAEANECLIKIARKYAAETKGQDHFTIVTLEQSFHGRTLSTLAATGQDHFHQLFQPLTPGFAHGKANDLSDCIRVLSETNAAAMLIECVQGEGGVRVLEKDFVQGLYEYCKANDILFLVDEVQTGNGRTGKLYAYMHYGITPDAFSTAKGLGGGLPIGACVMSEKVEKVLGFGDHGSTFGGNPVCCAGAVSILERLDAGFLQSVAEKGSWVFEQLKDAPGIEGVSGMGLMIGIKTAKPAGDVVKACMEQGVLCLTAKEKVRLLPALNISMDKLKKAIDVIKAVCAA